MVRIEDINDAHLKDKLGFSVMQHDVLKDIRSEILFDIANLQNIDSISKDSYYQVIQTL